MADSAIDGAIGGDRDGRRPHPGNRRAVHEVIEEGNRAHNDLPFCG